jgi:hypothetical protein
MGKQKYSIEGLTVSPQTNDENVLQKPKKYSIEGLVVNSKKKVDTELSGKISSTAGKFEVPDNDSAWYDWDNIKKAGTNLIDFGKGLGQEIPSETTRMVGDLISSFGLAVDLGGRYSSAGVNYLMGDKKQAQKDIDSDPTFLGKYLIDAGNYLSESADQTKNDTLKNWGVSEKNRNPQRSFYDAFSDGDLSDGSAMLFRDVLATVPQVAAAVLSGGGSLEAQALRTSGGLLKQTALSEMGAIASTELPAVLSTGLKSQTGAQFKFGLGLGTTSSLAGEYKKDNHVTATDFLESIARGVVEGASESLFNTDILAAKKLASKFVNVSDNPAIKGIMASIVGEGEDAAKQKIVRTTTDILGKAFAGGRNEGLEEVASSFGNMLIDATKQGGFTMESLDKFKRDAIESFIVGSLSGGAISGGAARMSRVKLTDVQQKTIDRYNEVINDDSVSDEAKGVAKERIKDILDYNASLSKDNYALIAALPKEKRAEALDYLSKVTALEDDIKNTKDSEDGSYHSELNNGIKSYEDKVNKLIEDEYKSQREARRKETMSQSDIDTEDIINFFQSTEKQGFSIEDMDSALNDIRARVNNKEEIDQEDIGTANDMLYEIIDNIEKSELTPEQKKVASEPFFNQIQQLESYDKTIKTTEVTTPVNEVTTTTRETGRRERPKTTVMTDRFNLEPVEVTDSEGNKSNFVAKVNEDGSISLVPKVKFSRKATEQKRKGIELDYNFLEFQESIKDENDRVVGAKLLDKKTGNIIEISNPELAIDLATKAKQDALGNVSEGVMQQDTTVTPIGQMTSIVKEFVNKKTPVQAPVQAIEEEAPLETPTESSSSPVGLPMRKAYVVGLDILKRTGNRILNKITPENKARISNNVKALKTILPDANVVLYDNREDMIQGLVNQGNSLEEATQAVDESKGLYSEKGNTIHIDVTRMDKETLSHEIFHPLVSKLAKENPAEFREMRSRISKALSGSDLAELNKFAELYDDKNRTKEQNENIKAEEFLAQLAALMASNKTKIERSRIQKVAMAIKDFLKKIAKKINSKALNDFAEGLFSEKTKTEELIKFFEGYGRSLRQGAPIDTKFIDNLIKDNKSVRTAEQITPSIELRAQRADVTKTPVAGNRLFNEPLEDAKRIATEYMEKKGLKYEEGERITSVDKERAKLISAAYVKMEDNYNLPDVKASYDAMIAETIDQYREIVSNGYKVEINDTEPYKNAQEFIDDLRDNKNFKLLSTLSEFGDTPVTEEMANNDPRLRPTEFKDVNGQTLLANDLFRFVHDFFGHTVRGNSLGAIGEENAWDEHSRMYTPLARKAMTTETRGQNSYVNFSGVNEKAFKLRDIARKLRAEGNIKDADRLVNKVYEMMQFAPQKLGLLPDEFSLRDDELKPSLRQQKVSDIPINIKESRDKESENRLGFETGGVSYVDVSKLSNLQDVRGAKEDGNRTYTTEEAKNRINKLKDSLLKNGWTGDSIIVDIDSDGYGFIDEGNHRLIAAKELGMTEVPVKVEFGLAREGISRYTNAEIVKNPTQIISKEKINELKKIAKERDYHIKYASIYLTDLAAKTELKQQKNYPDALAESREEYANKNKNTLGEVSRYVRKLIFERNINVKKAMQDAELEFSLYTMYNKAGASMFGNLKFTEQFNKIYGNLSPEEIKLLDNFVFLRRVIAIEDNFDRRGEEKPKHPMHLNIDGVKTVTTKETALATLNDYMDYLDLEVYDKVYTASDEYFKAFSDILKYKYENGLIDKDTYDLYKNYNYSPRIFLEHIFGTSIGEEALSPNNFYQRGLNLSTPELKKIKDGSDTGIMVNSAKLLHAAMIATEVRVASNLALKTLYEEAIPRNLDFVKEVEYEKNSDGTIKINEDGSLKYSREADDNFRIVTFKKDGLVTAFQLREDLAKEYFDEELFNKNSKAYKIAQLATGANILRNMATGMNIAFPITNIPVDAISQVQLNNIYDGASVGVAGQYAKVFTNTIGKSVEIIAHNFGAENKALEDLIYEYGKAGGLMMTLSEEYASKEGFLGQMGKYLGAFGNASEMGSKLTAYKTVKEREIAQFKEKNDRSPTEEEMAKIRTKAAYTARAAMDYHRGGLLTKWIDGFVPYLNVFTQGTKITADYIRNNPTAFTNKIIQTGLFVAALTIYNMAAAGADYDNDDNEQDLATKIVFFYPIKNEDGTRGKIEISVPAPVKGFLNIFQNMGEGIYYKLFANDGNRYNEWKTNVNSKFLGMVTPNLATNIPPALKAMVEYSYNLDLWRGGSVSAQMGKILPEDEGRYDKNVAEFYKIIGSATGASPKRLQKASENFITQSNPLVGLGYSIADKVVNGFHELPESQRSKFNTGKFSDIPIAFLDKVKGRVKSVTDPKVTFKKGKDIIDKINQEAGSKKQEVKAEMRSLVEKKASVQEMNDYLIKQDPIYRRSGRDYVVLLQNEKKLKYPNNKDEYFDVMTGVNAEAKAQIIYAHFPHLLMEGNENLISDLKMLNLLGKDTKKYITEYYKNKGISK